MLTSAPGVQEAVQELLQRVAEANACLPYSGIAAAARPDEAVLVALLSLLPPPPPPDANPPPPQVPALPPTQQRLGVCRAAGDSTNMYQVGFCNSDSSWWVASKFGSILTQPPTGEWDTPCKQQSCVHTCNVHVTCLPLR